MECYTVSSLEKVFPDSRPAMCERESSGFRNEVFSFQAAYFSADGESFLEHCTWRVRSALEPYITVRPVEVVPCTKPLGITHDAYVLTDKPCLVPDLLADRTDFYVRYRQWGALWVTVQGDLPAGVHDVAIDVCGADGRTAATCTYTIRVLDEMLPACRLHYAHWLHYDSLAAYYNVPVWSPAFSDILWRYVDNMVGHGADTLYVPLFTSPINTAVGAERETAQLVDVVCENGAWAFGFDRLAAFLAEAEKHGVKRFEMSHLYSQWGALHPPKIMALCDGCPRQIFGWDDDSLGDAYVRFVRTFLTELVRFLRAAGYTRETCYFHISDEPNGTHFDRYMQIREIVKPVLGDFRIMDALSEYEFYGRKAVDLPVVATDKAAEFLDRGVSDFWVYYCCAHETEYLSNRFMAMPLQRTRIIGMQLYLTGAQGFLHWGYNFYNSALSETYIDPYFVTDAGGSFQSGDSFIVYPGKNGRPSDSIRHEAMRDALQDYRALCLLESKIGRKETVRLLTENGLSVGFTRYPLSAAWHCALRRKINERIMAAQ